MPSEINNVVVLGGNGAMGTLFCNQFAETCQVTAIDLQAQSSRHAKNVNFIQADVNDLNTQAQQALSAADLVMLTLPLSVTLHAWRDIIGQQKHPSLLVDTLSVKTPFIASMGNIETPHEIISINPMFAPGLGFSDQSIIVVDVQRGPLGESFLKLLESWQCRLVHLSAEEHDRYTAMLQAATHAAILGFALCLEKMDYDLTAVEKIIPPPHRTMLALIARILSGEAEVYRDIQANNPYAAEARRILESSTHEISQIIENNNQQDFERLLKSISQIFSAKDLERFQTLCSEIFQSYSSTKK